MFFVQINHTGKGFLFLIFREIKLRKYSSLHKIFYGLAFLLRGQLLYIVAAIILAVLIIIKQVRLSKNMRSSNNNQL